MIRTVTLTSLAVLLAAASALSQETCPDRAWPNSVRPRGGDLGIDRYRCVGGACEIWTRTPDGPAHVFTTEPRIDAIDSEGPSADVLEVGDVLVAVNDLLVTTGAAGRFLANLEPGEPVRLWVRRDGHDLRLVVTPTPGCGPHGLSVRIPGAP